MKHSIKAWALVTALAAAAPAFAATGQPAHEPEGSSARSAAHQLATDVKDAMHKVAAATRQALHRADAALHRSVGKHDKDA